MEIEKPRDFKSLMITVMSLLIQRKLFRIYQRMIVLSF